MELMLEHLLTNPVPDCQAEPGWNKVAPVSWAALGVGPLICPTVRNPSRARWTSLLLTPEITHFHSSEYSLLELQGSGDFRWPGVPPLRSVPSQAMPDSSVPISCRREAPSCLSSLAKGRWLCFYSSALSPSPVFIYLFIYLFIYCLC